MKLSSPSLPEPVVLFVADISGYTRFMTANAKTLAHSHTIIAELSKLEGDAIFFYCRKSLTEKWVEVCWRSCEATQLDTDHGQVNPSFSTGLRALVVTH